MTRMEEFKALQQELAQTPPELDSAVERARERTKKRLWKQRVFGVPIAGAAALFAVFVVLVNVYVPFAYACSNVPGLKALVQAVVFNTSLQEALEHDYVQPVVDSQSIGEFTVTVDAIIADQKQINVFYHVDSNIYSRYTDRIRFLDADGNDLDNVAASGGGMRKEISESSFATLNYAGNDTTPSGIRFTIRLTSATNTSSDSIDDWETLDAAHYTFTFDLDLDDYAISRGEIYQLDQWITLEGQRIYLKSAEIYPTHIRINVGQDEANSAYLQSMSFYLEDENGNRSEPIRNGTIAIDSDENTVAYCQESVYFLKSVHWTLHITGAVWLDKGQQYTTFELATGRPDGLLPPSIYYATAVKYQNDLHVLSVGREDIWGDYIGMASVVNRGDYVADRRITYNDLYEEELPPGIRIHVPEGYRFNQTVIENYPYDDFVQVRWARTRTTTFDTLIEVPIK